MTNDVADADKQENAANAECEARYKENLAAEQLIFTVTNFREPDDSVESTPLLKAAFGELFDKNPGGHSHAFPFVASNGLTIDYKVANPIPMPDFPTREIETSVEGQA